MGLFKALVRTTVNVVTLPVEIAKDVVGIAEGEPIGKNTSEHIERIKEEADTND